VINPMINAVPLTGSQAPVPTLFWCLIWRW
jgi:hypothetical protein